MDYSRSTVTDTIDQCLGIPNDNAKNRDDRRLSGAY